MVNSHAHFYFSFCALFLSACHPLSRADSRIIGTWDVSNWHDASQITYQRDHTVLLKVNDEGPFKAGRWHLEGSTLVTEFQVPGEDPIKTERETLREIRPDTLVTDLRTYQRVKLP